MYSGITSVGFLFLRPIQSYSRSNTLQVTVAPLRFCYTTGKIRQMSHTREVHDKIGSSFTRIQTVVTFQFNVVPYTVYMYACSRVHVQVYPSSFCCTCRNFLKMSKVCHFLRDRISSANAAVGGFSCSSATAFEYLCVYASNFDMFDVKETRALCRLLCTLLCV